MCWNSWPRCLWRVNNRLFTNLTIFYRKSQNTQETRSQSNEKPRKGQFFFNSKTNRFLYDTEDKKKSDDTDKSLTVQFNNDMSLSLIQHRSNSVEGK